MILQRALEQFGGIATRRELIAAGWAKVYIDLAVYYRKVVIPRRGWYALPGTPDVVVRAIRVGGRLACVSEAVAEWQAQNCRHRANLTRCT